MSQQEMVHRLEARAKEMVAHMADINFLTEHQDLFRALILVQALNGEQNALDGVKDALRHGENAGLVRFLSTQDEPMYPPGPYAAYLSLYALMELDRSTTRFPEEDLWAMFELIARHYEPVPYAPYTREQLIQADS